MVELDARKLGPHGVSTKQEDEAMVTWVLNMKKVGSFVNLQQLKMKVAEITQTRPILFLNGVPKDT
jgi:hypothetical protein